MRWLHQSVVAAPAGRPSKHPLSGTAPARRPCFLPGLKPPAVPPDKVPPVPIVEEPTRRPSQGALAVRAFRRCGKTPALLGRLKNLDILKVNKHVIAAMELQGEMALAPAGVIL